MRCGRAVCPPGPRDPHEQVVRGAGDRAGPEADLPHGRPRVAVQGEDPLHAGQAAGVHHGERTAARGLLGGLEDQPDPSGQPPFASQVGEHQPGAQHGRGVHVVAAGVAHARHRRRVVDRPCRRRSAGRRGRRAARRRASPSPMSQISPVPPGSPCGSSPAACSRSRTSRVVRTSAQDSSGWACRSRRKATSSSTYGATRPGRSSPASCGSGVSCRAVTAQTLPAAGRARRQAD